MVDLTGKLPRGTRQLRLSAAFEIHWDRIAMFEIADAANAVVEDSTSDLARFTGWSGPLQSVSRDAQRSAPLRVAANQMKTALNRADHWLSPDEANLHWHGFGVYEDHPWYVPLTPMHDRVVRTPPWRFTPSGWATRYGDVTELLAEKDDALVVIASGDEVTLRFAADRLPPKPPGLRRDFFLFTSGWDKDSDYHVVRGDTIDPLPFHGMNDQEYGKQTSRLSNRRWIAKYNTRWVGPLVLPHDPFSNSDGSPQRHELHREDRQ